MPETPEAAADLQEIRFKLEAIEATQILLVRDRRKQLLDDYKVLFAEHAQLDKVYLAFDRPRTQSEALRHLVDGGANISQPTLSRRMATLRDNGLLDVVAYQSGSEVWAKNRVIEKVLQLTKVLMRA